MRIKLLGALLALAIVPGPVLAAAEGHQQEHGGQIFHAFRLEADSGIGNNDSVSSWDFDGWIGTDENKLWLKSEGERVSNETEQAEFWALYSRNIDTFWDAQIGLRHDIEPNHLTYLAAGFEGLAPYFFETEAHLFLSEDGDVTLRLRQENDFLLTQRLILQPYAEINFSAQHVPEQDLGAGINAAEIGLQTRYEITRVFVPYLDIRYERKLGETSAIAQSEGEENDAFIAALGLRLLF
ncbi:MAG TPA: copper resistance protein B [Rhodospirillaceae bacterium]|nr:copper resistance protein B [Rhodospirillaceae bacterium]